MGKPAEKSEPEFDPNQDWFTSREAAKKMRLKPSGLKSLVFRGKIRPDHRGGQGGLKGHRFRLETIEAYLDNKRAANDE